MHEMGITGGIVATALEAAEEQGATRINAIRISVGDLTDIVDFALQFAFEVIRQDTIAADAVLEVTRIAPRSVCRVCGAEFEHDKWDLTCPECGNFLCDVVAGRELRIDTIDIDTD
jgi:hydrogenase nickel incorporation protein HypA/HybF